MSGGSSSAINIIDIKEYRRIKQIECIGYIGNNYSNRYSSLHILNNGTFIYSFAECFCQISSTTYKVLLPIKMKNEFRGDAITSSLNGKYIIASKGYNYSSRDGISIFKVNYI